MGHYLGIDIGTSAVRCRVIDEAEQQVAHSRAELPTADTQAELAGSQQQDPRYWWEACVSAIRSLAAATDLSQIRALSIDATSASTLLCDVNGQPLTPALMYNDSRAQAQAQTIAGIAPAGHVCASPNSALAKALWLSASLPAGQRDNVIIQHQADWIQGQFSQVFGHSDINNCLKLGFDASHASWPRWISRLPLANRAFPKVYAPGSVIAVIDGNRADQLGFARDCQIVAGTTDSTAAIIAVGDLQAGDAVTALGSTLVVKVLSEREIADAGYGVYSHYHFGRWLTGGASNTGGAVLRQFFSLADIERLSAGIDPNSDCALDYYPLLRPGERFPIADPALAPRLSPRPSSDSEFLHGLMLGVAKIEKLGYDRLYQLGAPYPSRVLTMGGGANSELWRRLRERVLGVKVENVFDCEAAAGAARLARLGYRSISRIPQ